MRTVLPLVLGLAACTADTLDIELEIAAPDCQAADFAQVSVIAIAVYGEHDGTHCALARRCVYAVDELGPLADIGDFNAALRGATQPLVDGLSEGAEQISVIGRASDCWDPELPSEMLPDHPMCGANDFAEAEDGAVPIVMGCGTCEREEYELCP